MTVTSTSAASQGRSVAPRQANILKCRFPEEPQVGPRVLLVQERRSPTDRKAAEQCVALMVVNSALPVAIALITNSRPDIVAPRNASRCQSQIHARLPSESRAIDTWHMLCQCRSAGIDSSFVSCADPGRCVVKAPPKQHLSLGVAGHHRCKTTRRMFPMIDVKRGRERNLKVRFDSVARSRAEHNRVRSPHESRLYARITRPQRGG